MGALPLPTDSIQRRHLAQLAATLELPFPPEDSVLRRHYDQLFATRCARHATDRAAEAPKAAEVRATAPAPTPPARAAAAPQPASASVSPIRSAPQPARPAAPVAPAAPQGFFSRIFAKLFG